MASRKPVVRDQRIEVRVSGRELATYHRGAAHEGVSLSEWIRWLANSRASEVLGLYPHPAGPADTNGR